MPFLELGSIIFMLSTGHKYFLAVVSTGSIKLAAEQLHVAASAISRQIAKLEQASGVVLFERRPQGMVLTRAGEMLADYARRVAMESERVLYEVRNVGHDATVIRIGSNEAVARNILPVLMGEFNRQNPDVVFQIQIGSPSVVAQKLAEGSIDLGIAFNLKNTAKNHVRHEVDSPVRVMMAPTHPLAMREHLALDELKPYPIALTESGTTVRLLFDSLQAENNPADYNLAFSSNSSSTIRSIVELGYAVTLAGEVTLMPDLMAGRLVAVPLLGTHFKNRTLQVQTAYESRLPNVTERFLFVLSEALDKMCPGRA